MNNITLESSIGSKIRNWRNLRGLSQQELLADRYSESYLSKVERGQMQASEDFLAYVASRLGLTVDELINELPSFSNEKRISREAQELSLLNTHVALQTNQVQTARTFLEQLIPEHLPTALLAEYFYMLGLIESRQEDFEAALLDLEQSLKLFESDPRIYPLKVEQVRDAIGLTYYQRGNYLVALRYHKRCLQAVEAGLVEDNLFKIKLYFNLASESRFIGEPEASFNYYKEAEKVAEAVEELAEQARAFWNLSMAYQTKNDLTMARMFLDKSATLYQSLEELKLACSVKGVLGRTLLERDELGKAEAIFKSALAIAQRTQDKRSLWSAYLNLASLHNKQGQLEQAEQNARLSIDSIGGLDDQMLLGQSLAQLAEIRLAQGANDEGLDLFEQAVEKLHTSASLEFLQHVTYRYATALENLNRIEAAMKMYRLAFEYQKQQK